MVAGGSGITPMVQVLHALLDDPNDKTGARSTWLLATLAPQSYRPVTEITLLYASRTERDIILRQELDGAHRRAAPLPFLPRSHATPMPPRSPDLARKHPRFKVHYTVSCPEAVRARACAAMRCIPH